MVAYYEGLAKGKMAVVAPVSAITLSLIPFMFGLLTGERYALLPWIGVAIAAPAMWLTVATGPARASDDPLDASAKPADHPFSSGSVRNARRGRAWYPPPAQPDHRRPPTRPRYGTHPRPHWSAGHGMLISSSRESPNCRRHLSMNSSF